MRKRVGFCLGPYQEEESVVVMVCVVRIVHAEGSVNVAKVVMLIQFLK